ncbi:ribose-phosphate pyrophosphokinase [Escherichia coli]|nr:ribose-phosphate pyrophosphokinase [Escherichia coli]
MYLRTRLTRSSLATRRNNLRNSVIDEVVVCDTIPLSDEIKSLPNVRTLTLSGMLAEAIRRISNEESISAMFEH